jgi:hypothetical protein
MKRHAEVLPDCESDTRFREQTDSFGSHIRRRRRNRYPELRVSFLDIPHLDAVPVAGNEHFASKFAGPELSE